MRKGLLALLPPLAFAATAVGQTVDGVTVAQDASSRRVEIAYSLSASAIVTVEFHTNTLADASGEWLPIGVAQTTHVVGDAFRLVQAGSCRMHWLAEEVLPDADIGAVKAVVKVWSTEAPPPIRVYDSISALAWYYEDAAQIPTEFSGTGFTQTVSGGNAPASTAEGTATGVETAARSFVAVECAPFETPLDWSVGYAELDSFTSSTHYATILLIQ